MSSSSRENLRKKRIRGETRTILKNKDEYLKYGVMIIPNETSEWTAYIKGPNDSPYENGIFQLKIVLGSLYPITAPEISFVTKIFHPNIYTSGNICVDFLGSRWKSVLSIYDSLISIISLLTDPNCSSPANSDASSLYSNNRSDYNKKVKEYVNKYCLKEFPKK